MSDTVISVERLGKRYQIEALEKRCDTLRERIVRFGIGVSDPLDRKPSAEAIWALKDVSFRVQRGEVVGIIGRNGAGKTTLLKILSRVTEPTEGITKIHGRVGSLLEVGIGFHPELTGGENIYLNGSLLGMRKREIDRRFDEIVAFAEIEKFVNAPMKHYSSGMQVRLGFAIAAYLEPEILLADEVLAVGDTTFQKKCLGKMQEVSREGRTVLFVSHNMPAITRVCQRTIWLEAGRVLFDGPSHQAVRLYLQSEIGTTAVRAWSDLTKAPGNDIVRLLSVRARNMEGRIDESVDIRKPVVIEMEYAVLTPGHALLPVFYFFNEEGVCIFATADLDPGRRQLLRPAGRFVSTVQIPGNFLAEGSVIVTASISTPDISSYHVYEADSIAFHVVDRLDCGSVRGDYAGPILGVVRPFLPWTTEFIPNGHAN